MTSYHFYTLDVFTHRIFGGNPLAVFPDARGLSADLMQKIAGEFNLSETVFILPPEDPAHTRRLRIFSPSTELSFAGHPTIGAAYLLAKIGEIPLPAQSTEIIFEEGVGEVPVTIFAQGGQPLSARLTATLPQVGPSLPPNAAIAEVVSLLPQEILDGEYAPQAMSCGVPYALIPVRDREAVRRARLNHAAWEEKLKSHWAPNLFLFAFQPELPGSHLRGRMFAPALGIAEDPATGAAASALGGYLGMCQAAANGAFHWRLEQGFEMGRPSLLEISVEKANGEIGKIQVGGTAVLVSQGMMDVGE
ncbi:MAG: PhzF family phenazine biosynthesis protein [Anaerolineales bacterium]|nr:PhzF family phenazine biosynthesis protein [Anaerolineales bacterium]